MKKGVQVTRSKTPAPKSAAAPRPPRGNVALAKKVNSITSKAVVVPNSKAGALDAKDKAAARSLKDKLTKGKA